MKEGIIHIGLLILSGVSFGSYVVFSLPVLIGLGLLPCSIFGFLITKSWYDKRVSREIELIERENLKSALQQLRSFD